MSGCERNSEMGVKKELRPHCKLVGEDGNVYNVIAIVERALKKAGMHDKAKEWGELVVQCEDYDDVLRLTFSFVDAE